MEITKFEISEDNQSIIVEITDAEELTSLNLWTDQTYKDYSKAINLMPFLEGAAEESFSVSLEELNLLYFDGIYFIEAETEDEISYAITSALARFKECILNKVLSINTCDDCLPESSTSVLNAHTLLVSLETAISLGFISEMLQIIKTLNKYCSKDCVTCGNYSNIMNNGYYSYRQND